MCSRESGHVIGVDVLGSKKVQHLEVIGEQPKLEDCSLVGEGHMPIMATNSHREVDHAVVLRKLDTSPFSLSLSQGHIWLCLVHV